MKHRFGHGFGHWERFFGGEDWAEPAGRGWPFAQAPGKRMDRGDVKYLILTVLQDGPKHGYEIIKEIETRSQGTYSPSAGTVYPTLQMLEDMGHVRSRQDEERRVYEITDAGRAYLAENQVAAGEAWGRFAGWNWRTIFGTEEQRQLRHELMDLAGALFASGRIFNADEATLQRVRSALQKARTDIEEALAKA